MIVPSEDLMIAGSKLSSDCSLSGWFLVVVCATKLDLRRCVLCQLMQLGVLVASFVVFL
jgi:hypothetical protein